MKRIIISVLLYFFAMILSAQNISDSIQYKRFGPFCDYYVNYVKLTNRQLADILRSDPEAVREIEIAKTYSIGHIPFAAGCVLLLPCAFYNKFIGFRFLDFVTDHKLGVYILGMGAAGLGLILISLPFDIAFNRHAINAVKIYNGGLRRSIPFRPAMNISLTTNAIGLRINF